MDPESYFHKELESSQVKSDLKILKNVSVWTVPRANDRDILPDKAQHSNG